jgi:hypothetical protein
MLRSHSVRWCSGLAVVVLLSACTMASPPSTLGDGSNQDTDTSSSDVKSGSRGGTNGSTDGGGAYITEPTCTAPFAKPDLSTLASCGGGAGHCYPKEKTPNADMFGACPTSGDVCVGDEILSAGGGKLKSCTVSILSAPGACVTLSLMPDKNKQVGGLLKQDGCDGGQLCVPCTDPTTNTSTQLCDPIGVRSAACSDGSGTTTPSTPPPPPPPPPQDCCTTGGTSNGVCLPPTAVPADARSNLPADTCTGGNLCVPKSFASGNPVTCNSGFLGAGVCMDRCFNQMLSMVGQFGLVSGDGCGPTELCAPCAMVGSSAPGCGP